MSISVFELYSVGIGPSSSHTVGPMRAARQFLAGLAEAGRLEAVQRVEARLYGSLASTGKGHGTDRAVLMGLEGEEPETIDPSSVPERVDRIAEDHRMRLFGQRDLAFDPTTDLLFCLLETLPQHPNGMRFTAFDAAGETIDSQVYFSVGGGFIVDEHEVEETNKVHPGGPKVPLAFRSGVQLLELCEAHGLAIWQVVMENEKTWREESEVRRGLLEIAAVMSASIDRGCHTDGILPGGLNVKRRAHRFFKKLGGDDADADPLTVLDWVSVFAMAVNEENAAGGRVVTAPTNGAAGIVPAVIEYYKRFKAADAEPEAVDDAIVRFLLTAGAIGILFKENASISGAEVGCQGEVGVACSMAAAGLAEVTGGTPEQVENAAEIGMEHHLGLTCDPIGGLVQIPCIERNAVGASKAIQASRLALRGDGDQKVTLDQVIRTMRQTGADMMSKYKETAQGGLAVHVPEC
ncbi:MAG: L-serine ammonia-lyase [Acidobacteriota bacterium]